MRVTPQREMVLHVLQEIQNDATAEEIHAMVSRLSPAVDLSTVYRTLDLFIELNLVSSFEQVNGDRRFELLTTHTPHFHLLCQQCGELTSISLDELQPLANQLRLAHCFELKTEHLVIPGICAKCKSQTATQRKPKYR